MNESAMPPAEPERWLPVPEWEDLYEVSDLGRVRRILRWPGRSTRRGPQGAILSPRISRGRPDVCLFRANARRSFRVHTLVAAAFIGPCPEGMEVCHGPGGSLDNRLVNLSYGTRSRNNGPDKYRDGTIALGVRNGVAKLDDDKVREIRARCAAGETRQSLASEFGVSKAAITFAVRGVTWKHVA